METSYFVTAISRKINLQGHKICFLSVHNICFFHFNINNVKSLLTDVSIIKFNNSWSSRQLLNYANTETIYMSIEMAT